MNEKIPVVPAVHEWASMYWETPDRMTEYGIEFVRWLRSQKQAQARVLADAVERYDSVAYFQNRAMYWLDRFARR